MAFAIVANLTRRASCTDDDLLQEEGWTLTLDVGLPAKQTFTLMYGTLLWMIVCVCIHVVLMQYSVAKPSINDRMFLRFAKCREFWFRLAFCVIACALGGSTIEQSCRSCYEEIKEDLCGNWHLIFWYGFVLILTTTISYKPFEFFLGEGRSPLASARFYFLGRSLPTTAELEAVVLTDGPQNRVGLIGFKTLAPSVGMAWVSAKSIFNSANLGGLWGVKGGVAYAGWYISFMSAAIGCYLLRTKYNIKSLPQAVHRMYGNVGAICFMFAVMFRLFNEVWSNAAVIGSFYGGAGSKGWWGGAWFSCLVPCVYVTLGGMKASLLTQVKNALFATLFFIIVWATISTDPTFNSQTSVFAYQPSFLYARDGSTVPGWYDDGWWTGFAAGLIQGCSSYPFMDPTLTDKGFLSTPKTMVLSFAVGGIMSALFITFFSVIGIYGTFYHEYFKLNCNCLSGSPGPYSTPLCPTDWNPCSRIMSKNGDAAFASWVMGHQTFKGVDTLVAFVMITACMSSVGSIYASWSKVVSLELGGWVKIKGDKRKEIGPMKPSDLLNISESHLFVSRVAILFLFVLGVAFLGMEKNAMSATDAVGTMVMGLGPPMWMMCFWRRGHVQAPLAYIVPAAVGFVIGYLYYDNGRTKSGITYDHFQLGDRNGIYYYYARLLGTNLYSFCICSFLFIIFFAFHQFFPKFWFWELPVVQFDEANCDPVDPDAHAASRAMSEACSLDVESEANRRPQDAQILGVELERRPCSQFTISTASATV